MCFSTEERDFKRPLAFSVPHSYLLGSAGESVLLGQREALLLCSGFERRGSNRQEALLLWKAPWGLGSSFRNLCGRSLEGNKKERNKEVGIPRAEIFDMPVGLCQGQDCRGGETPARAPQVCPHESVGLMEY